jgi:N utilization substance protein B
LNETELVKEFVDKTPNWDSDRIVEVDTIILKWPFVLEIPFNSFKVTLNEYLELAKEYSTQKQYFINGILDNLVKELEANKKMIKTGRGLM